MVRTLIDRPTNQWAAQACGSSDRLRGSFVRFVYNRPSGVRVAAYKSRRRSGAVGGATSEDRPPPPHPHRNLTPPQPRWTGGRGTAPRPPVTSLARVSRARRPPWTIYKWPRRLVDIHKWPRRLVKGAYKRTIPTEFARCVTWAERSTVSMNQVYNSFDEPRRPHQRSAVEERRAEGGCDDTSPPWPM